MYHSGEVRWFFPGPASAVAERWIAASEHSTQQAARTDRYLVLPGCGATGIKIREGHFEIKARTSPPEAMTWSESIAGFRDTWVKWSRDLNDVGKLGTEPRDGEAWVDVSKQRQVVVAVGNAKQELEEHGAVARLPAAVRPGEARRLPGLDPERELWIKQLGSEIDRALGPLPSAQRQAFELCEIGGMDYSQIAELQRVPIGTVRSRLNRARQALRKQLHRMPVPATHRAGAA